MRFKKGDNIIIISGNNKGKTGIVEKAIPSKDAVIINGVNVVKKHIKPSKATKHTGLVEKPMPIHASNILLICGNCKKNTKVQFMIKQNEKRRICSKCKEAI